MGKEKSVEKSEKQENKMVFPVKTVMSISMSLVEKVTNALLKDKDVVIDNVYDPKEGRRNGFTVSLETLPPKNNTEREMILARQRKIANIVDDIVNNKDSIEDVA
jgi:hypothetical protein